MAAFSLALCISRDGNSTNSQVSVLPVLHHSNANVFFPCIKSEFQLVLLPLVVQHCSSEKNLALSSATLTLGICR